MPDGWTVMIGIAAVAAFFICQHLLLLALVALFKRRVQPILWLLQRSRPAIRAMLHLSSFVIFVAGILFGFSLSSNAVLIFSVGLSAIISSSAEWTFMAEWGPLANVLRAQELEWHGDASNS